MKTFKSMAPLEGIERRPGEVELELAAAHHVIAGCSIDADPPEIDRGGLGHLREHVRRPGDVVGIDVLGVRGVDPGQALEIELAELIALQDHDRARTFATGGGQIVADAEVAPIDVQPHGLRRRIALGMRDRGAAQQVFLLEDLRAGSGRAEQHAGERDCAGQAMERESIRAYRPAKLPCVEHVGRSQADPDPS
jgi:hypothetical protein